MKLQKLKPAHSAAQAVSTWHGAISGVWWLIGILGIGSLSAIVASTVDWVKSYGAIGIWIFAICGSFIAALTILVIALIKRTAQHSDALENWRVRVDSINPLLDSFKQQRIFISDIKHPFFGFIKDKNFAKCEIYGPANIFSINSIWNGVTFHKCEAIVVNHNTHMNNIIPFQNVNIQECSFFNVVIFITPDLEGIFRSMGMNVIKSS